MQINKQPLEPHAIQSYSESTVKVNNVIYDENLLITRDNILTGWPVKSINDLNELSLKGIMGSNFEVLIIGYNQPGEHPPISLLQTLSHQRIGLEYMSIGAACRTFNVLLNEGRAVALGLIF